MVRDRGIYITTIIGMTTAVSIAIINGMARGVFCHYYGHKHRVYIASNMNVDRGIYIANIMRNARGIWKGIVMDMARWFILTLLLAWKQGFI
jgi:hypothetical protein